MLWLLLLLIAANGGNAWREVKRPCAPGCEQLGNCNHEFGTCECPFGRTGPACETHLLGACRTSNHSNALPFYGFAHPKSCECWRQLYKIGWDTQRNAPMLEGVKGLHGHAKYCYERKGLPPEQQFSSPPDVSDPSINWFQPLAAGATVQTTPLAQPPSALLFYTNRGAQEGPRVVPLDQCPDRCSERGSCVEGHCQCMQGYAGSSCDSPHRDLQGCMNKCSGRGTCVGGFCHCPAGWWGQDCSRSRAWEPDPENPTEMSDAAYSRTALRIYRWELPWTLAFPLSSDDTFFGINHLYSAFEMFYEQFSGDAVVRTENPYEANLFYIPLLEFYKDDNAGDVYEYTRRAMHALKNQQPYAPFWARNEGRDHFVWLPGDLGACWLRDEPEVQNPIKVVHWGLQINASAYTHMPHYWWVKDHPVNKDYHCFKHEKDVVVPCWVDNTAKEMSLAEAVYEQALKGEQRRYLLFFGGGIRHEQPEYSGGARQAFDKHVISKNHQEVLFGGGRDKYREATFCLAPYGDGWGSRLPHIMQAACVPVIVQEYVHQPFDDVLHYEDFSIRLNVADMPRLLDILKAVTPEQVQVYRQKMYEVHKAFHWIPLLGGQAYNHTLLSLHQKLINLWGGHYR